MQTPHDKEGSLDEKPDGQVQVVDLDGGNTDIEGVDAWGIDPVLEKKVIRKMDLCITLLFALLYMFSFLDRANIGNAKLTTFSKDIGLVGNQYGAAVSVVYSTYVLFEPIWAVVFKILGPRNVLTGGTVAWAVLTIGTAFVKNFPQLVACRVLLGIAEASIMPCITLYFTMYYNRDEYGARNVIMKLFAAMSGAFGGLLAFGLTQIQSNNMHGWQWMYIVEGLLSMMMAPVTFLFIPVTPTRAWWLKPEEREVVVKRMERNHMVYDDTEKFSWAAIRSALSEHRLYCHAFNQFATDCTLYSLTTFMPSVVAGLGFTTTVQAQLLTVPVYVVAFLGFWATMTWSDKYRIRAWPVLTGHTLNLIGFIILVACEAPGARYAGVFIAAAGLYQVGSINLIWANNNNAGHFKRAFSTGLSQLIGNTSGAIIGFIFTSASAPRYKQGFYFNIGMMVMGILLTVYLYFYYKRENVKKQARIAAGEPNQPHLGDRNPHYSYYL